MAVIGVDSSGIIKDPPEPVWMAAVRKVNIQDHNILYLSTNETERYRKKISDNWREKLAAALVFRSLRPLIKKHDIIQIHKDFMGYRVIYVGEYLHRLFGKEFYGKYPLSDAKIQFIPGEGTDDIQLADEKSYKARHKKIDKVFACPDLSKLLAYLE